MRTASVIWNLKQYGFLGWMAWMWRAACYRAWLVLTPNGWRESQFDELNGTDTSGYVSRESLGLPKDSIHYAPIKPLVFHQAMSHLAIDPRESTFIDIGCGKGRALVLAKKMGFRRIIGVERSRYLAAIAYRNAESDIFNCHIENCDATAFDFPNEDSVIFLFNPFWRPTMDRFVENLEASLRAHPRKVYVVYVNPFCKEAWEARGARKLAGVKNHYAVYDMSERLATKGHVTTTVGI